MNIGQLYIQYQLPISIFYSFLVATIALTVWFKVKRLHDLTAHRGIKLFGLAFFFFSLSHYVQFTGFLIDYLDYSANLYVGAFLFVLFAYLVSLSGFYLVYSLVWKQTEGFAKRMRAVRICVLHIVALSIALISVLYSSEHMLFIPQLIVLSYGMFISYNKYQAVRKQKKQNFLQFYFIALVLMFTGWLFHYINVFVQSSMLCLYIMIITLSIFLIFLYGVFDDFTRKRLLFLGLFTVLVFISSRINFSALIGPEGKFLTFFEFIGPLAGGFLGPLFGMVAVLLVAITNFFLFGGASFNLLNILLMAPMVCATYYFGTKKRYAIIIPLLAMGLFMVHPVGRQAWFYSLFWLIPVIAVFLPRKLPRLLKLFFKSLGATFLLHSVGCVIWIYFGGLAITKSEWIGMIPVTAYERLLFAVGIAVSYVIINTILDKVIEKTKTKIPPGLLRIDKNYVLLRRKK